MNESTFSRLPRTRNTERYRRALQLARLIILNYNPDIQSGGEDVLAILFDMNQLYERFIYAQLKKAETRQASRQISFKAQVSRQFWTAGRMHSPIRPDIIAECHAGSAHEWITLDTKWKIPDIGRPADADLHQMHSYNVQFGSHRGYLLYPKVRMQDDDVEGKYVQASSPLSRFEHSCGMLYVELFDEEDQLRRDLGDDLIKKLVASA